MAEQKEVTRDECYNCKPSAPMADDPKVLCPRCARLYCFVNGWLVPLHKIEPKPADVS